MILDLLTSVSESVKAEAKLFMASFYICFRPRKNSSGRVQCFTCGSLFNTDAPDCFAFNVNDKAQMKTCDAGEACLWYSYQKSDQETAVIRECFSTGILLGR